jgi:hypothetical protein
MERASDAALMLANVSPPLVDATLRRLVGRLQVGGEPNARVPLIGELLSELAARSEDAATGTDAVTALVPFLEKGNVAFKKRMVEILGAFGKTGLPAVPALEKAYLDPALFESARSALQKITGKTKIVVNPKMTNLVEEDEDDLGLDLDF